MEALDRAGGQGEIDLHPGEPAVDFLNPYEGGARVGCRRPFSPDKKFPTVRLSPGGSQERCSIHLVLSLVSVPCTILKS